MCAALANEKQMCEPLAAHARVHAPVDVVRACVICLTYQHRRPPIAIFALLTVRLCATLVQNKRFRRAQLVNTTLAPWIGDYA